MARRIPLSRFEHRSSQNIASLTRKRVSLRNIKTKAIMAPTTDSTNPLLLTQKDWPLWFQFIRREVSFVKIWDYIDPDKTKDKIKENTKPDIPSIAAAPAAPTIALAALVVQAAAPVTPAIAPAVPAAAPIALAVTPASTGTATPALLN